MNLTYLLIVINIIVYIQLGHLSESFVDIEGALMVKWGFNTYAFSQGAIWQPLTSMFVHFDLPHLGYNMIFLFFFGHKAQELFGMKKYLLVFLLTGLVAQLPSLYFPPEAISAGSSGAIFGILGAVLSAQRGLYPSGIWTSIGYGLLFFILAAATGFLAHLMGLIAGFLLGYILSYNWYQDEEETHSEY